MSHLYLYLIALLSLFLNRVDLTNVAPLEYEVHVSEVLDGDTIEFYPINGGKKEKLRIAKIDAPELGQRTILKDYDAGLFSKRCLKNELKNRSKIRVSLDGRDMYGRWLGDLKMDGKNLSAFLVQKGCVGIYPFATFKNWQERDQYISWYEGSKEHFMGIWKWGGYMRPYHFRRAHKKKVKLKR